MKQRIEIFVNACNEKEDSFKEEELRQLHQWQLWQEELESGRELSGSLQDKCYDTFTSEAPQSSALKSDVMKVIKAMGLRLFEKDMTESGYRLDAVIVLGDKEVGLEIDGPDRFIGKKPKSRTILKRRQVHNVDGIRIFSVPYWEWIEMKGNRKKKQHYLQKLLNSNA